MNQTAFVNITQQIETTTCCSCGVLFGFEASLHKRYREDHEFFCCPNGHRQHYTGKSEADKLRAELEQERQRKVEAWTRANAAETRALKVERKLRRVHRGVCPECNRAFENLARHMKCKHEKK